MTGEMDKLCYPQLILVDNYPELGQISLPYMELGIKLKNRC